MSNGGLVNELLRSVVDDSVLIPEMEPAAVPFPGIAGKSSAVPILTRFDPQSWDRSVKVLPDTVLASQIVIINVDLCFRRKWRDYSSISMAVREDFKAKCLQVLEAVEVRELYRTSHIPIASWVAGVCYALALFTEWRYRFGKEHKAEAPFIELFFTSEKIPDMDKYPFHPSTRILRGYFMSKSASKGYILEALHRSPYPVPQQYTNRKPPGFSKLREVRVESWTSNKSWSIS